MACSRNIHRLCENRTFSIRKHEQRYIFFNAEDKIYGVMADWIKSVQNKNWDWHDFENCTLFNFLSHNHCKTSSIPFMMRFDDITISLLIDATQIGILARINEVVLNSLRLIHQDRKAVQSADFITASESLRILSRNSHITNIIGAKCHLIQQMVNITANKVGMMSKSFRFDKTLLLNKRMLHKRDQLLANNLLIKIYEPVIIDKSLVGMWSISWEIKSDKFDVPVFLLLMLG